MGLASRREAETWITEGRVSVNGKTVKELGAKVTPGVDDVKVDGKPVVRQGPPRVYWLLNKPDETLTAREDSFQRRTIYELPKLKKVPFLVSPVGRLDYRTEGLLLLTNDGELAHRLCSPKFKVPRTYHVLVGKRLSDEEENALRHGVKLEDGVTGRTEVRYVQGRNLGASRGSWYIVTVYEGRNRLVRRMFEQVGYKVVRLVRVGFGDLRLPDDLKPGEYLQLDAGQIHSLKRAASLK